MRLFDFVMGLFRVQASEQQQIEDAGRATAGAFWTGFREETHNQMRMLSIDLTGRVPLELDDNHAEQLQDLIEEADKVAESGNGYSDRQRPELVSLAASRGVKGSTRKSKAQLVQSLKRLDARK